MKNLSYLIIVSEKEQETEVTLEGQLTINNVAAIKRDLLPALNNSQQLNISLKNVIKIDLSVLQLLVALQKSAAKYNKKFSLNSEVDDNVKSILISSGLQKIFIPDSKSHFNAVS